MLITINNLEEIDDIDFGFNPSYVVSIICKNESETITTVIKKIDEGIQFYNKESVILIADGNSSDGTQYIATKINTKTPLIVISNKSDHGKGDGIKLSFLFAKTLGAEALATIDGDMLYIRKNWVERIISPILNKKFDMVNASYLRSKNDAIITRHMVFPLMYGVHGIKITEPLAGERAYSSRVIKKININDIPNDYGVDLFLLFEGMKYSSKIKEIDLGVRIHNSVKKYTNFNYRIDKMFNEVVRELNKIAKQKTKIKSEIILEKPNFSYKNKLSENELDAYIKDYFIKGFEKYKQEITRFFSIKSPHPFNSDEWTDILHRYINLLLTSNNDEEIIKIIKVLWYGRLLGFMNEVDSKDLEDVYRIVFETAEKLKTKLKSNFGIPFP